jgi:hypothetical protein
MANSTTELDPQLIQICLDFLGRLANACDEANLQLKGLNQPNDHDDNLENDDDD